MVEARSGRSIRQNLHQSPFRSALARNQRILRYRSVVETESPFCLCREHVIYVVDDKRLAGEDQGRGRVSSRVLDRVGIAIQEQFESLRCKAWIVAGLLRLSLFFSFFLFFAKPRSHAQTHPHTHTHTLSLSLSLSLAKSKPTLLICSHRPSVFVSLSLVHNSFFFFFWIQSCP